MLRRVLTYHLILAVAVGPLLCCCSAGRAAASPDTPVSSAPAPAEPVSSCCSHKRTPATAPPAQKPAPAKPGQPPGKCPCKDRAAKSELLQSDAVPFALATLLRTLALDSVSLFD